MFTNGAKANIVVARPARYRFGFPLATGCAITSDMMINNPKISTPVPQSRLDWLRGAAAIYVVMNHVRGHLWIGGEKLLAISPTAANYLAVAALQLTSLGEEAVILFFVLSAFAMAHSIRISSGIGRFYAKRIIRIWPPYIAAVLFAMLIGVVIGDTSVRDRFLHIIFYDRPGGNALTAQFWSLPYEVLFYALCPLLLANERRVRWSLGIGILGAVVTFVLKGPKLNPWHFLPFDFIGCELLMFACGALAYYNIERVPRISGKAMLATLVVGIAVVWLIRHQIGASNPFSNIAMIALSVMLIRNLPDNLRFNFGSFSYSIYIFHFAIISLIVAGLAAIGVRQSDLVNPLLWVLALPPIVMACYGLYYVTERISNERVNRLRHHA